MRPVTHPPDAVLRAYGDLLGHVFCFLRIRSNQKEFNPEELFDLADAMHNIGELMVDYGAWTDDEKYRRKYLRRFDEKWGARSIRLEEFLEAKLQQYLNA